VVIFGAKITLTVEEPSFLSVCQLASNVYDRGPISASSHLTSGSSIIFLHDTSWIDAEDKKLSRSCAYTWSVATMVF
jgi:hypothetical protein